MNALTDTKRRPLSIGMCIAWIGASVFAGLIGQVFTSLLGGSIAHLTLGIVPGATIFLSLGITQALLLRYFLIRTNTFPVVVWALLTAASGCAGTALGFGIILMAIMLPVENIVVLAMFIIVAAGLLGTIVGFFQSLVLDRYTSKAGLWVFGNALAWAVASLFSVFVMAPILNLPAHSYYLRGDAPGLWSLVLDMVSTSLVRDRIIYGTVLISVASVYTGITLVLLLKYQHNSMEGNMIRPIS